MSFWRWNKFRHTMDLVGRRVDTPNPVWKHAFWTLGHERCRVIPKLCDGTISMGKVDTSDDTENLSYCVLKRRGSVVLLYRNDPAMVHVYFDERYELWALEPV